MARPLRIEYPGAIYHVTRRMIGNWRDGKERLFRGEGDCARFLEQQRAGKVKRKRRQEDVAFRRVIQPLEPQTVMRILSEVMGVEEGAFLAR